MVLLDRRPPFPSVSILRFDPKQSGAHSEKPQHGFSVGDAMHWYAGLGVPSGVNPFGMTGGPKCMTARATGTRAGPGHAQSAFVDLPTGLHIRSIWNGVAEALGVGGSISGSVFDQITAIPTVWGASRRGFGAVLGCGPYPLGGLNPVPPTLLPRTPKALLDSPADKINVEKTQQRTEPAMANSLPSVVIKTGQERASPRKQSRGRPRKRRMLGACSVERQAGRNSQGVQHGLGNCLGGKTVSSLVAVSRTLPSARYHICAPAAICVRNHAVVLTVLRPTATWLTSYQLLFPLRRAPNIPHKGTARRY